MTTIIQKMWRDGVPGPGGGLVQIAPKAIEMELERTGVGKYCVVGVKERPTELPVYKCNNCDQLTITENASPWCACGRPLFESERL